jgi:hypothetical protein
MLKYTRFASKVFKQFRVQFSIVLIFVYDNASMKKPYIIKKINLQSNNLGSDLKVDLDELVGQNCNSVKSRILCLRFINIEIIPLNTVLVNRFLKSFCKIIETMSYYFLYLMYKYRLKRGKPILSLSFYATSIFRNSSSA